MRIGLIDVDGHHFPSLPLMKLSAYHKSKGDTVKWYDPLFDSAGDPLDIVYMSKVFSFTPDFEYSVNSKKVVMGGQRVLHRTGRRQRGVPLRARHCSSRRD